MAVPSTVVTNEDLTKILDTSDEWIYTRTGIKERHIVSGAENSTDLGIEAAKDAIKKSGLNVDDIDLIIAASSAPKHIYPSTACAIQDALGMTKTAPAFDITAACTGLIYGIEIARAMISTGVYKNVLIVATDATSKFVDWSDRGVCVLFGDGAGAMILQKSPDGIDDILAIETHANGAQGQFISLNLSGQNSPLVEPCEAEPLFVTMNGKEVYKFVMSTVPENVIACLEKAGLTPEDIDYLVPHQANMRIIEGLQQRLKYGDDKVVSNIEMYGNTSAASIPIAMCEAIEKGKMKLPATAILTGFGAGLTWGTVVLKLREGIY
jgi:3-oxoacyl-[acyl-carrier-protein] synthase-3